MTEGHIVAMGAAGFQWSLTTLFWYVGFKNGNPSLFQS